MELMSSVLLCALLAFLPQTLGDLNEGRKFPLDGNIRCNDSLIIRQKVNSTRKNIILNKTPHSIHNYIGDVQSLFMDPTCRGCYTCMKRAIKARKSNVHIDPRIKNYQRERNMTEIRRDKRKAKSENTNGKKIKRSKSKKSKGVTLTKYNDEGKVYALKIKETNSMLDSNNKSKTVSICQVYTVHKSLSCESSEAILLLTSLRKKTNKKDKKGPGKREVKTTTISPIYTKRNVDDSQLPDQIMPSIEEFY